MALWKITTKRSGTINGVRVEKGMFVELACNSVSNPVSTSTYKGQIAQLFMNKYGLDLEKAHLLNTSSLDGVRMDK